jgi:hypothetical protein
MDKKTIERFRIEGLCREVRPLGSGRINDTFLAVSEDAAGRHRYILQRLNHCVFKEPRKVADNIGRVTAHLRSAITAEGGDPLRETMKVVAARDGRPLYCDDDGSWWRVFLYIERTSSFDTAPAPLHAFEAARAFGRFQRRLADFPPPPLFETIPGFHDTARRLDAFMAAVEKDPMNRAAGAAAEIGFILGRETGIRQFFERVAAGAFPPRVTHNDTKINNVLFDSSSGRGICVIDLDTVMSGLSIFDFGDLVRSAANRAGEEARDSSAVRIDMELFGAIAQGYLKTISGTLTGAEVDHLVFSAKLMALEQGMRFVADHLEGDRYYKTDRPGRNLDRGRIQLALVKSMELETESMESIVRRCMAG